MINNMKPTPIKWLLEQLKVCNYISKKGYKNAETWLIQEALEYEQEQQDEFAINFIKWTISQEADDLIDDLKIVGEVSKIPTSEEILKVYKRFKNK